MSREGRVQVVVRSRQVPSRTVEFPSRQMLPTGGRYGAGLERGVVFESVLDDEHRKAIEEGRRLACSLGLALEVVDQSKLGLFRRMLSSLRGSEPAGVSVVVSPLPAGAQMGPPHAMAQGR